MPTAAVANLVADQAATAIGASTANAAVTVSNTIGAGPAVIERTGKGGLHVLPSQTADVAGSFFQLQMTQTLANWLQANESHWVAMAMSARITRMGNAGNPQYIARTAQNGSNIWLGNAEGSSRISMQGLPTPNHTTATSPGLTRTSVAAQGASMASITRWFFSIGPQSAGYPHKAPSVVLYDLIIEDLTLSAVHTRSSTLRTPLSMLRCTGWAGVTTGTRPQVRRPCLDRTASRFRSRKSSITTPLAVLRHPRGSSAG